MIQIGNLSLPIDGDRALLQKRAARALGVRPGALGELTIPVPPNKAGAESVEVTFTYDINSLLEVEVLVNSTGQKHRKVIQNGVIIYALTKTGLQSRRR